MRKLNALALLVLCSILFVFCEPVRGSSSPDWDISYSWGGTNIINNSTHRFPLNISTTSIYNWPGGAAYGDLYKGSLNNATIVTGHSLGKSGSKYEFSDAFSDNGSYFVIIYDISQVLLTVQIKEYRNWFMNGSGAPPPHWGIINFSVNPNTTIGPWPDTGQTKCYDTYAEIPCPAPGQPFYGQDAQYQGPTRSYTKLGQNGIVLPDAATYADGWVVTRDNVTGLIWEMKTVDGSLHDKDKTFTWCDRNPLTNGGWQGICGTGSGNAATDTEAFIQALNDTHYGGFSDWRMPTIKELSSLVNSGISYPGPTIDSIWFPHTSSYHSYWSSTIDPSFSAKAWRVWFGGATVYPAYRNLYSLQVRAVRGSGTASVLVDNGDGTVTDTTTGLMWQKATAPGGYTFQTALAYAESLDLAGYTDWRLPNRNELQSLVDYSRDTSPLIDPLLAPHTVIYNYWSSTSRWYVNFGGGHVDFDYALQANFVRAVRAGQSVPLKNLFIAQHPMSGPPGTTFVQSGTGFTPSSTATLYFTKPDGTEFFTQQQPLDAIGHFETVYTAPWNLPSGTYTWWAVDGVTGAKSNDVSYDITPLSISLDVQTINPQTNELVYQNFFPSPKVDQLISGGNISSVIAADGESRLLLRIVANNPGQVTISESQGNTQQNGSISDLDRYRDAAPASSVSVQLQSHGGKYIGFAVYRAPKDFSVPGYENRLTRPITLNVTSTGGSSNVSLILRRPPIIISHGLWSWGWGNEEIERFRNMLWTRFEDSGSMDVNDYIWLNDCLTQNADSVFIGSAKTRSNIREYLSILRSRGATVTKVDYLGHSMGGQWGRLVEQRYKKDAFTYDTGYLHKLITLDTPHIGSFIADIGQFLFDHAADIPLFGGTNAKDYMCWITDEFQMPVCYGAIKDLTSYGSMENLKDIKVPSHAILGNKHIDTACALLSASTWVSGGGAGPIVKFLKVAEMILKKINPNYGCENWFNKFDFSTESDYVVGLHSQKGGLNGSQLSPFEHKHTASFHSDVNQRFFELLNKGVNDNTFATGFPASSTLLDIQNLTSLKADTERLSASKNQTPLGDIQFSKPANGTTIQPGAQVNLELTLTGNLTLNNVLIVATGSDAVELFNPPYAAVVTVPADAHGTFTISALGEGADGNLYSASVTLSVASSAVLQKVEVTPQSLYLNFGQELNLSVTGTYSDGSIRSLSSSVQGTSYKSSNENILSVSGNGKVTTNAVGVGYVLVSPASAEPVTVRVEIAASYMDADFSADHLSGNPPFTIQFRDLSAGYFTSWRWDFGDHQTSTEQNPVHTYLSSGVYTVTLTISGTGGENTESKKNFITIGAGSVVIDGQPDAVNTTALWTLTGPNSYSQTSVGDQTLMNLTPGDYTLTWEDISGWTKPSPASSTQTLNTGATITFVGFYQAIFETVSAPVVSGPTIGVPTQAYSYTASGSTSNLGHTVEYQFDWKGDGSDLSAWGAASQSKTWAQSGNYSVKTRARCATHQEIVSAWSTGLAVAITASTADRIMPGYYGPGYPVLIQILVTPDAGVQVYAVEDTPPAGWTVSEINESGTWDGVNGKVKWGPFFGPFAANYSKTFAYKATSPIGETGKKTFAGTASFDGLVIPIGGATEMDKGTFHPADTTLDYRIAISECTAYGFAWKTGATWSVGPNPIPIGYMTNACYLWKVGEVYHFDPNVTPPYVTGVGAGATTTPNVSSSSKGADQTGDRKSSASASIAKPTGQSRRFLTGAGEGSKYMGLTSEGAGQVSSRTNNNTGWHIITVEVTPARGVQGYAVEETLPIGVEVQGITHSGNWDRTNGKVKWGPFLDNMPRTLQYQIRETGTAVSLSVSPVVSLSGSSTSLTSSRTSAGRVARTSTLPPSLFAIKGMASFDGADVTTENTGILAKGSGDGGNALYPVTWMDFDGDGRSDLAELEGGTLRVVLMSGDRELEEGTYTFPSSHRILGYGDWDGDGRADILLGDDSGNVRIWLMDGAKVREERTITTLPAGAKTIGMGDVNGDGVADLLWRDGQGAIRAEVSVFPEPGKATENPDGTGGLDKIGILSISRSSAILGSMDSRTEAPSLGDYDGDGRTDILWREGNGALLISLMTETGIQTIPLSMIATPQMMPIGTGDIDGNGTTDILWRDAAGNLQAWLMSGASQPRVITLGQPAQGWEVIGVGDYDGDGIANILCAHSPAGVRRTKAIDALAEETN